MAQSKKAQSEALYELHKNTLDRSGMIQLFVDKLEMTENGAKTYYSNCKRQSNGGEFNTTVVPEKEGKLDKRTLYTIYTPDENESGIVVGSTASHYDLRDAKKACTKSEVVVKGLPELDSKWSLLKPIK